MENTVSIDLGERENTCFVVMPFASLFQLQYKNVIRPAVEATGLKCKRGDEIYSKADIVADIWKSLREAQLVVAELTGRNPNVLYEIGLAHAIGKPIIFLTRNKDDVPFDLKALRYLYYETDDPFWGEHLIESLKSMIMNVLDNPELSKHLEGVHPHLSTVPKPTGPLTEEMPTPLKIDLSGQWQAEFATKAVGIPHFGTLVLQQIGADLSGVFTITYEKDGDMTVIQETLIGSISSEEVRLNGISYTYVKQGHSTFYNLDNFILSVSEDGKQMGGKVLDPDGENGENKAVFTRLDSQIDEQYHLTTQMQPTK